MPKKVVPSLCKLKLRIGSSHDSISSHYYLEKYLTVFALIRTKTQVLLIITSLVDWVLMKVF
jgi:hypothetical protein